MARSDGLPNPHSEQEQFMAAILDELRGLRADLRKSRDNEIHYQGLDIDSASVVNVKETQSSKKGTKRK